jgi:TRAP-type C4-dicarboxylate transport system substrate-binding protein
MDKGVIDGLCGRRHPTSRKLSEVVKYVNTVDLGHDCFFVVMNQQKWDSLSPEIQKVFNELSATGRLTSPGAVDKFDNEALEEVKGKGVVVNTMPAQEQARWKKILAPIADEYAAAWKPRNCRA